MLNEEQRLLPVETASYDYLDGVDRKLAAVDACGCYVWGGPEMRAAFVAGARWQAEQIDRVIDGLGPDDPALIDAVVEQIKWILE